MTVDSIESWFNRKAFTLDLNSQFSRTFRYYRLIVDKARWKQENEESRMKRQWWRRLKTFDLFKTFPYFSGHCVFRLFFSSSSVYLHTCIRMYVKYVKRPRSRGARTELPLPTLLFTNYECCKTERNNDLDETGPIFVSLSTVSLRYDWDR